MYCSDLLNANVAIEWGVLCFMVSLQVDQRKHSSNQSLVSLDTEDFIHFEASVDPGLTSWNSNLLPSNSSYDCVATLKQYYPDLLYQKALENHVGLDAVT